MIPAEPSNAIVLDTNVVLDLLFFGDPRCAGLEAAVASGAVRWAATAAMRAELESVLERGSGRLRAADVRAILERFDRWALPVEPAARCRLPELRCADPDDQMFIDLALQVGARTLLSRDKAVLGLAHRAQAHALRITTPARWADAPGCFLPPE